MNAEDAECWFFTDELLRLASRTDARAINKTVNN